MSVFVCLCRWLLCRYSDCVGSTSKDVFVKVTGESLTDLMVSATTSHVSCLNQTSAARDSWTILVYLAAEYAPSSPQIARVTGTGAALIT